MAKTTIYLPDRLAEQVRSSNLNMSAVCQRALKEALTNEGIDPTTPEEREAFDVLKNRLTETLDGYQKSVEAWQQVAEQWKGLFHKLQAVCDRQQGIIDMLKDQLITDRERNTN